MGPAIVGALGGIAGGSLANRSRSKEAEKNRGFQERMRNTSWQAAVADMEAAGINPALAYSQGGAASPSGSMPAQENVGAGVSSSMQNMRLKKGLGLLDAQTKAATQQGVKTQREAYFQEMTNRLWGGWEGPGERNCKPGPLWEMNVANARTAGEAWKARMYENVLLKNMSDVASTAIGQKSAFVRYLMQAWKGGR